MSFPIYDGGQRFINEVGQRLRQIHEGICALNRVTNTTYSTEVLTSVGALASTPSNTKKIILLNTSADAYITVNTTKGAQTLSPKSELQLEVGLNDSGLSISSLSLISGTIDKIIINYTRITKS